MISWLFTVHGKLLTLKKVYTCVYCSLAIYVLLFIDMVSSCDLITYKSQNRSSSLYRSTLVPEAYRTNLSLQPPSPQPLLVLKTRHAFNSRLGRSDLSFSSCSTHSLFKEKKENQDGWQNDQTYNIDICKLHMNIQLIDEMGVVWEEKGGEAAVKSSYEFGSRGKCSNVLPAALYSTPPHVPGVKWNEPAYKP